MRQCVECKQHFTDDRFSIVNGYYVHRCKECVATAARERWAHRPQKYSSMFERRITESGDKEKLLGHLDEYGTMPSVKFHELCELDMNIHTWYRYERKNKVQDWVEMMQSRMDQEAEYEGPYENVEEVAAAREESKEPV